MSESLRGNNFFDFIWLNLGFKIFFKNEIKPGIHILKSLLYYERFIIKALGMFKGTNTNQFIVQKLSLSGHCRLS